MSGFSVERLINSAALAGIVFWDVQRTHNAVVICAKVSRRDYMRLQDIATRTGTKLKVARYVGLPSIMWRFRKRVVLLAGCAAFIVGLVVLTSFIWYIEIEGTQRLDDAEIFEFLADNGFEIGTFRHGIAYREVESLLMAKFPDIAWVSLVIDGTAAHISLVETIEQPQIVDLSTPTDIVAAKDGIILQMATSLGTPLFVPGDVVQAGEVLVSGQLTIGVEGEEITHEYVRATSEIWARLYYSINFDVPLVYYEKTFTGRVRTSYSIMIGSHNFTLPHGRHNFIHYEAVEHHGQLRLGYNYPLPLGRVSTQSFELVRHLHRRTVDEAVAIGEELVAGRIAEELPETAQIITREISFAESEHAVTVEVFLVTIERIDEERKIQE